MPRIRLRAKRIHKIKFADGKIFTILDVQPNPQTGEVTLYLRERVGMELLLVPIVLGLGLLLGWMAFGATGAFIGAIVAAFGGYLLVSQTEIGSKPVPLTLPQSAIIGFDSYFQLKNKSYCFCVHTRDSEGGEVLEGTDPISISTKRCEDYEFLIRYLRDQIANLQYNLTQGQKSSKELVDETASSLKKIIESTVTPTKARRDAYPSYPPTYPTEPLPEEEEG